MELIRRGQTLLNTFCHTLVLKNAPLVDNSLMQVRNYAARRGTRMKADKKKVKVEIKKIGFIPHSLRKEKKTSSGKLESKRIKEEWKSKTTDNVWIGKYHPWRIYSFEEAVQCHRETHHPTVLNRPNAPLQVFMELDMRTSKPTKFVEKFTRTALVPHGFNHGEDRSILVFCKSKEEREAAENAGATLVGGVEVIKDIEKGRVVLPDFNVILAHTEILPDMIGIRGLLKKRFPNPKTGTLGSNMQELVTKFKNGVTYSCYRDEREVDYGSLEMMIGTLNMDTQKLRDNFQELVNDVMTMAPPNTSHPFITRVLLKSPPTTEKFKLDLSPYLSKDEELASSSDEEDDENVRVKYV
ncbi:hypothetical protein LSTR_LSTR001730 [Laodelphax striatellus]|uniref:39S ribosomal protein L1, mitochondrial n=1 Tax=Laodelphax striatellus TaxID=195883 RepID=A0A482XDF4_LAOST|nr:hypothetical protein LSTR_LSTR001730 [Laodelphax striatellus]